MSALSQLLTKGQQLVGQPTSEKTASKISLKKIGEAFWCGTSLVLFLVLGPFAAVAALMGVASLVSGQAGKMEPESISQS